MARPLLIAALGSSFAAGPGIEPVAHPGAMRSARNYPHLLAEACAAAGIPLTLRMQPGYDHSYYFISTFMADHLRWHAARLTG